MTSTPGSSTHSSNDEDGWYQVPSPSRPVEFDVLNALANENLRQKAAAEDDSPVRSREQKPTPIKAEQSQAHETLETQQTTTAAVSKPQTFQLTINLASESLLDRSPSRSQTSSQEVSDPRDPWEEFNRAYPPYVAPRAGPPSFSSSSPPPKSVVCRCHGIVGCTGDPGPSVRSDTGLQDNIAQYPAQKPVWTFGDFIAAQSRSEVVDIEGKGKERAEHMPSATVQVGKPRRYYGTLPKLVTKGLPAAPTKATTTAPSEAPFTGTFVDLSKQQDAMKKAMLPKLPKRPAPAPPTRNLMQEPHPIYSPQAYKEQLTNLEKAHGRRLKELKALGNAPDAAPIGSQTSTQQVDFALKSMHSHTAACDALDKTIFRLDATLYMVSQTTPSCKDPQSSRAALRETHFLLVEVKEQCRAARRIEANYCWSEQAQRLGLSPKIPLPPVNWSLDKYIHMLEEVLNAFENCLLLQRNDARATALHRPIARLQHIQKSMNAVLYDMIPESNFWRHGPRSVLEEATLGIDQRRAHNAPNGN